MNNVGTLGDLSSTVAEYTPALPTAGGGACDAVRRFADLNLTGCVATTSAFLAALRSVHDSNRRPSAAQQSS